MNHSTRAFWAGIRILVASLVAFDLANDAPASGPLRVHPTNPRYLTDGTTNADGSLKAIYLGGHQIFVDLQDNAFNKEWTKDANHPDDPAAKARLLDWERYLEWTEKLQFNYLRHWIIWSTGSGTAAPPRKVASPMPFLRTGPGNANDGKPKFDLHRFDEGFFKHLHARARALQQRGVYLPVMLFELYRFLDGEEVNGQRVREGNPVNGANNINGVDLDRNHNRLGEEFFRLDDPELVKLQKAYVEKMVDSLNELDDVLWEICNEAPGRDSGGRRDGEARHEEAQNGGCQSGPGSTRVQQPGVAFPRQQTLWQRGSRARHLQPRLFARSRGEAHRERSCIGGQHRLGSRRAWP